MGFPGGLAGFLKNKVKGKKSALKKGDEPEMVDNAKEEAAEAPKKGGFPFKGKK